jgi:hypothetical protein
MARLDRLGPAKEVIQVGAVIGSEFSYDMLHAVYPIAEADLQGALRKLTDAELLYVRGLAPEATYLFKHALIRDAAYEFELPVLFVVPGAYERLEVSAGSTALKSIRELFSERSAGQFSPKTLGRRPLFHG